MDLTTITSYREARSRTDLALRPGETLLAGGTWLFSEPQRDTTGLVDLTTLGWAPWEVTAERLSLAATCTVEQLLQAPWGSAAGLARRCTEALLMSGKVQRTATVGGNVCLALPAAAMVALLAGLGAEAVVWTHDDDVRREPLASLVRGVRRTSLAPGEVLRSVEVPLAALAGAAPAFRRTSLAPTGRSSAVVVGTAAAITVTASTTRPVVLDPGAHLDAQLDAVDCWYDDPHGPADWREAVTRLLVHEVAEDVAA